MTLLQKTKLISLLNKVLRQTGKQTSEDEITFICPFHNALHNVARKKFGIKLDSGEYNCFACGVSGKSFRTLFKKLKSPAAYYKELNGIVGEFDIIRQISKEKSFVYKNNNVLPDEFLPLSTPTSSFIYKHAINYIKQRGITRDDVLRYNIGYCERGNYQNRIIIPSYNKNGILNFFTARDFFNYSEYKYLLPSWNKDIIGNEIYINWKYEYGITLCEGSFDAISIRNNAIPLFGKMMSETLKYAILDNNVKRVNILLDNDAILDAVKIYKELKRMSGSISIHLIIVNNGKDASELGFNKINSIITNSTPTEYGDLVKIEIMEKL